MVDRCGPRHREDTLYVPQPRRCRLDTLGGCGGPGGEATSPLEPRTWRGRCLAVSRGLGLRGRGRSLLVFAGLSSSEVFGVPNAFTRDDGRPWASAPRRLVVQTHIQSSPAGAVVDRIDPFGSCGARWGLPVLTCTGSARPSFVSPSISQLAPRRTTLQQEGSREGRRRLAVGRSEGNSCCRCGRYRTAAKTPHV